MSFLRFKTRDKVEANLPVNAEPSAPATPVRPLKESIFLALGRLIGDPVAAGCFVTTSVVVFLGLRSGWLPGHQFLPDAGPGILFLLGWIVACVFVSVVYVRPVKNDAARSIRRLFLCCLLTVVVALTPNFVGPLADIYAMARYVSLLLVVACFSVLVFRVLPKESKAVWTHLRRTRMFWVASIPILAVFLVEFFSFPIAEKRWLLLLLSPRLSPAAILANALILAGIIGICFALTNRLVFSLALVTGGYLILAVCNVLKLTYLHAPVQPLDVHYVGQFIPYFFQFFGVTGLIVLIVGGLALLALLYASWRRRVDWRSTPLVRFSLGGVAVLLLAGCCPPTAVLTDMGFRREEWDAKQSARENGLLVHIALQLPFMTLDEPEDYSRETVERICREHQLGRNSSDRPSTGQDEPPPNVIVLMVESFLHPDDLGIRATADAIPTIRKMQGSHSNGYAIVPGLCRGSANSEFELLTGFSMQFLPAGSCAYTQYLRRKVPSLAELFGAHGYHTATVHNLRSPSQYNSRNAYSLLGFQEQYWLADNPQGERQRTGRWPSDAALVDKVIDLTAGEQPAFVFAFAAFTHSPYDFGYPQSNLDVADPVAPAQRREIKAYLNALHHIDQNIARLVSHLEETDRRTVLVVVGDHVPPLSAAAFRTAEERAGWDMSVHGRRVPLLIWSNFRTAAEPLHCKMNLVPAILLEACGFPRTGQFALVETLLENTDSRNVDAAALESQRPDELSEPLRSLTSDYRLIQWDVMFGENYSKLGSPQ